MKKRLKCRETFRPTKEEVDNYIKVNGLDDCYTDIFLNPRDVEHPRQFWEAVRNMIDTPDFDRWRYFQKVIGHELDYGVYWQIANIFNENDIEILDMPSNSETLW